MPSFVWDHFTKVDGDCKAECTHCSKQVSRGSASSWTTTAMRNHLSLKHPKVYSDMIAKEKQQADAANQASTSQPSSSSTPRTEFKNKIKDALAARQVWSATDARALLLTKSVAEFIALDNQPFSVVEDVGFVSLMHAAERRYKVPSRFYFSRTAIPALFAQAKAKIKELLHQETPMPFVSLTTDMWSSSTNDSFISLTGHWIAEDMTHHAIVLACRHFLGEHTGEAISDMLLRLLEEWAIPKEKVHLLLRDQGRNIVKAAEIAEIADASCLLHILHNVVKEALSRQNFDGLLTIVRGIVGHFNHSPKATEKLHIIQRQSGLPEHQLVQDVSTRWNSTFLMLARVQEQKSAILLYAGEHDLRTPSYAQWQLIDKLVETLHPFYLLTKAMSSSYCPISCAIPHVKTLEAYLAKDLLMEPFKASLCAALKSRTAHIYNLNNAIATFIDPRFKGKFLNPDLEREVVEKLKDLHSPRESSDDETASSASSSPMNSPRRKKTTAEEFWSCFEQLKDPEPPVLVRASSTLTAASSTSTSPPRLRRRQSSRSRLDALKLEIQVYESLPPIARTDDALTWWAKQEGLPFLRGVARRFLAAPVSSIFSEQAFSEAGIVFEERRSNLLPRNGEALLFLHHNIPLLKLRSDEFGDILKHL